MKNTIDQPTSSSAKLSRRRPYRSGAEVVAAVEVLAARGMKRPEIGLALGMDGGHNGGLQRALQRAGRFDLIQTISPERRTFQPEAARELAARLLAELPEEDVVEVLERRQALLGNVTPAGRQVRGPGGVVRWVAA